MSRPVYGLTRKIGIKISRRSLPLYEENTPLGCFSVIPALSSRTRSISLNSHAGTVSSCFCRYQAIKLNGG